MGIHTILNDEGLHLLTPLDLCCHSIDITKYVFLATEYLI